MRSSSPSAGQSLASYDDFAAVRPVSLQPGATLRAHWFNPRPGAMKFHRTISRPIAGIPVKVGANLDQPVTN